MKKIKVYIDMAKQGYSAYMDDADLDYGCMGEGKTVEETIADFHKAYAEMQKHYQQQEKPFEEVELEFFYDTASFLQEFVKAFSLAGLERITGVNQTQLGHYLHGRSKPSRKTIARIEKGVHDFARNLTAIRFA
ncbi:MAG: helix-turn-helix transcriptional regulator [Bacteroidales bacterium]|nr:helix-turn-helix transcriptional regulator [Bacteroidales bacterium]